MTDPQKDEHIEELLSKLQGIFGKLSHSEEEPERKNRSLLAGAPEPLRKNPLPGNPGPATGAFEAGTSLNP